MIPRDKQIFDLLKFRIKKWVEVITNITKAKHQELTKECVTAINVHVFGDANIVGNCAVNYVTVYQPTKIN